MDVAASEGIAARAPRRDRRVPPTSRSAAPPSPRDRRSPPPCRARGSRGVRGPSPNACASARPGPACRRVASHARSAGRLAAARHVPARGRFGIRLPPGGEPRVRSRRVRHVWRHRAPHSRRARPPARGGRPVVGQPARSFASFVSAAPRGPPWALFLPSKFGAPRPIRVFSTISVGRSISRRADASASDEAICDPGRRPRRRRASRRRGSARARSRGT